MIPGLITEGLRRIWNREAGASRSQDPAPPGASASRRRTTVPVGQFSLVGLMEVREQLGPRWPEFSQRVHAVAQSVISKKLLPGDVFEQHDEESYLVLFAQLGPKEAEFKSRAIGQEIARRLIGEDFAAASSVRTACTTLPIDVSLSPDAEAQLIAALRTAPAVLSRSADDLLDRASPLGVDEECMAPARPSRGVMECVDPRKPQSSPSPAVTPIGRTAATWCYTPIWDLKHRAVIHFQLTSNGAATQCPGSAPPSAQMIYETDKWALQKAIGDLVDLSKQGKRFAITCPVHPASLDHPACRRELLRTVGDVPAPLRRLLTIEVVATLPAPLNQPLNKLTEAFKALGPRVSLRIPVNAAIPAQSYSAFSTLTAQLGPAPAPEVRQIELLDRFAAKAQIQNLPCGAAGLRSTSLILSAVAANYRYLSGPAVLADVECISHAVKFDLDRLYC